MKNIKIYTDAAEYLKDLKYWSNSCGELHHFGERDITEDGNPNRNNFEQAVNAAKKLADIDGCTVFLSKELGFPSDDGDASELVVFIPATISKEKFDLISKKVADVAYSRKVA